VQGDAVEHLDLRTTRDHQPFHHVEAVQFPPLRGDLGQMPTRWWSGAPDAFPAVQGSPTFEDAVDGPHRRKRLDLAALEGLVDDLRSRESQVADLLQLGANGQDQILDDGLSPVGSLGGAGTVVPGDPVESLPLSLLDPVMDHGLTDVELTGDIVLGLPPSDGGADGPTTSGFPVALLRMTSGRGCGFSVQITPES
jgi:hypothetical protein